MKTIATSESRTGLTFLLVFVLLAAGIIAAGWLYSTCYDYERVFLTDTRGGGGIGARFGASPSPTYQPRKHLTGLVDL